MRRPHALLSTLALFACGQSVSCGGCMGIGPIPGAFTGTRGDSAAATRLTATGFDVLNVNAPLLLQQIAPGGDLDLPLSCSIQNASLLGQLAIADEGAVTCTSEACGQLDGKCDSKDVPKLISVHFDSFHLQPKAPDQIEAVADITLTTNGKIMMSSPQNHVLCLFSDQIKLSVDLDTQRRPPAGITIAAGIRFTVDTRWWKLLAFEVATLDGTKACGTSGAQPPPACIDSMDMIIASENGCSGWIGSAANTDAVKNLILAQLTSTLQDRIEKALGEANCRKCDADGMCPANGVATSFCKVDDGGTPDAGDCFDPIANHCVPGVLGVENRIDIATLLKGPGSALDVSIAAGGATRANDAGFTLGFTGGAQEVVTASCVKPVMEPMYPMLPLPDFDRDAPGPYDLGISLSHQMASRLLLHAQQSGALCLELGHESVSLLDTSLVGSLLPSLNSITHGAVVPMRVVVRPINAPTAGFGSGLNGEPLITVNWNDAQVDVYAQIEERFVRLFSVTFDLALPLRLSIEGCATITPVIGSLTGAITDVHGLNSEMLAEPLTAVEGLVPALVSFAEPALSGGLMGFSLPAFGDFQVKLLSIQGVGNVAGTRAYNHLGVYAQLLPASQVCVAMQMRVAEVRQSKLGPGGSARLDVTSRDQEYSWRLAGGLWSEWKRPGATGWLEVEHPRLMLDGRHVLELRTRDAEHDPSPPVSVVIERHPGR